MSFLNSNTGVIVGNAGTILTTSNGGNSWTTKTTSLNVTLFGVSFGNISRVTAVGGSGTIVTSADNGQTWGVQNSGTYSILYAVNFVDDNYGCAVGEAGTILTTENGGGVYIKNISTEIPGQYYLGQNYPNPFNPNTSIIFKVRDSKFIQLKVYDILGKELLTLVDKKLAPGTYEISFDGSKLSSGTYFYRLSADNYVDTKKMLLIK